MDALEYELAAPALQWGLVLIDEETDLDRRMEAERLAVLQWGLVLIDEETAQRRDGSLSRIQLLQWGLVLIDEETTMRRPKTEAPTPDCFNGASS